MFLQAEDGIRDYKVTGVQTCALPISANVHEQASARSLRHELHADDDGVVVHESAAALDSDRRLRWRHAASRADSRSEERRVGKEGRRLEGAGRRNRDAKYKAKEGARA